MRKLLLLACMASGFSGLVHAATINATFSDAEYPSPSDPGTPVQTSLPFFLGSSSESPTTVLFLRYKIPDVSEIEAIDSFTITVAVFDDGDAGGESADIQFALPGENVDLASFTTLNGTTETSPAIFTISSSDLSTAVDNEIEAQILTGVFRIRVARNSGDFYVGDEDDQSVTLDVSLTPEPSSLALGLAAGLFLAAGALLRTRMRGNLI